jgi:outer membrane murein-binding lipoprotein Lpp
MGAVMFDTLKLATRLEEAGLPPNQARGFAAALGEGLSAEVASKADVAKVSAEIAALRAEVKADINALRAEFQGELNALRSELKGEINALRAELKGDTNAFRSELRGEIAALGGALRTEMAAQSRMFVRWMLSVALLNAVTLTGAIAVVWRLARP